MEIKEIQNLIKFVAKSGAHEVKLETDDFKITIKTNSDAPIAETSTTLQTVPGVVVQASQPTALATEVEAPEKLESQPDKNETDNLITIKSPMIGTFYRKPSPEKDVFIEVGDTVKEGDVLCVVEAMKLFNEIESEVSGKIVKILVDDSSPVEFDQPLFLVEPA
ncbi:MAG: acetyl-CoA carboxylase, biotin carboxyl carrier protein [Flavobacteriaceae bacterium]|nr:acetyl-CoA carboxylase, biotin carboxyl carrier protein [Flavobacteriaceae bacterium]|tara:strand:+ start:147 stop:638 length:492 start_codon:yes stop_codon:yes gene_type:complete